ncbi:MAG TPA: sigma-70 family RNA polymerase sigma factor, partial [Clostridia bacterium]|nr:sigma-70 family RNA polymerase sigma factor [Clostridia bacterium]
MMSDRDLLRDFAERRSECAFQTLVQRHINLVFGTALRQVGQATAAQEVTQDVFIALARRAAWLRVETSLAGWLYQTTVLKCRQRYRADSRRQQREQTAVELSTTMKDDDSVLKSLAGVLDEGLLELRESERQALLLRFFDGRNHREVGLALGIGEDAARKRVDKALAQLTDFFKKRGYAIGSVALAAAALEAAAVPAPAGLAAQAARAALAQASVGPLHWLADCLAKLLCPNKAQTAVVCTALLLGPGLWQGARWLSVIEEQRRLEALLATLQTQRDSVARERTQIEQQLRRTSNRLAQLRSMSEYTTQLTEANLDPRLFRWDESADYVRVSKTVMRWLTFRNPDNDDERTLNLYGAQVSPTLLGALGLNAQEQASVQEFFQGQMKAYQASAQSRSYLTNLASLGPDFSYVKLTPDSRAWVTPALTPEESKAWSEHFQAGLSALIGPERA